MACVSVCEKERRGKSGGQEADGKKQTVRSGGGRAKVIFS